MRDLIINGAAELNIPLSEKQANQLMLYAKLLVERNKSVNLTAITDDKEIATKHFLDSLTAIMTGYVSGKVIDVGTGAGFPGLVLKIAKPEIELTLLDSLKKRVDFLEDVAAELRLDGIEFIHARAEDCGQSVLYRGKFDAAVSRAVADMSVLSEWCLPFLREGGRFLALKGPLADEELKQAERAVFILGGEAEEVKRVQIPFADLERRIIIIKKAGQTPIKYPRKAGIALKKPIEQCYNLKKK